MDKKTTSFCIAQETILPCDKPQWKRMCVYICIYVPIRIYIYITESLCYTVEITHCKSTSIKYFFKYSIEL